MFPASIMYRMETAVSDIAIETLVHALVPFGLFSLLLKAICR